MLENCKHVGVDVTRGVNVPGSEAGENGKVRARCGSHLPCAPLNSEMPATGSPTHMCVSLRPGDGEAERMTLASDLGSFAQVLIDWANSRK